MLSNSQGIIMRRLFVFCLILFLIPSLCLASRGIFLDIKKPGGGTESIPLYKESHALLVGVSDYTNGWPDLNSVPGEINELEAALNGQGFKVTKVLNPDKDQLTDAYEDFIDRYGYEKQNRLLFFFSGHGYSRKEAGKGYIVPTNAPSPLYDERGFMRNAVEMEQIVTWARRIESKHAMFLFDSCFSGTVFQSRALPKEPPHISAMVSRPVRQFISAGSAGEEVPSRSIFVPSFIRAIEGDGDLDKDGYVTGTELGMYLNRKVMGYKSGQTPQYGKIRDPRLDQGDFVMVAGITTYSDVSNPKTSEFGTLSIHSEPYGAIIYLNGTRKGIAPLTIEELKTGRYLVRVKKEGYDPKEETVLIRAGRKVELNYNLDAFKTTGSIQVTSTPSGAKLYLDGAYVGTTPDTLDELTEGEYEVIIRKEGFKDYRNTVAVDPNKSVVLKSVLKKTEKYSDVLKTEYTDPITGMEFVLIKGGCFMMGSDNGVQDEKPVHEVCLDDYYLGKYEVTNAEYRKIVPNHSSGKNVYEKGGFFSSDKSNSLDGDRQPVVMTSWLDSQYYLKELNRKNGMDFRLPTEAEWEYACRSGSPDKDFCGSNDTNAVAWYWANSEKKTHIVGQKQPSALGIYDMSGNVWERCSDYYYGNYYAYSPTDNPKGPDSGSYRLGRGGGWQAGKTALSSSLRVKYKPEDRNNYLGFRVAFPAP